MTLTESPKREFILNEDLFLSSVYSLIGLYNYLSDAETFRPKITKEEEKALVEIILRPFSGEYLQKSVGSLN